MPQAPWCTGSTEPFQPDQLFSKWCESPLEISSFEQSICETFSLPSPDSYKYLASGSTTLPQAEKAIRAKRRGGLHAWYVSDEGKEIEDVPLADIEAYVQLFSPSSQLEKSLKGFSQAKKGTLRYEVGTHLLSRLHLKQHLLPSKKARQHINPYYDFWSWSCKELEWTGPWPITVKTQFSHHVLPVFYHHFGCVCPSYQALSVIARLAQPSPPTKNKSVRPIFDVGSGNGYWTYMLRNLPLDDGMKALEVHAVDNQTSLYRTIWISDTEKVGGDVFLKRNARNDSILLLVYPQAGGNFTEKVLRTFKGDTIVVAGTQNANGFTGFADCLVDDWVAKHMPEFSLEMRFPLPSFAGKDDALFVFFKQGRQ